jgi:hypothetical protein
MTILKVILENGDCGTAFCTDWQGQDVLVTCDHVLVSLRKAPHGDITFGDGVARRKFTCSLRYHADADIAVIIPPGDFSTPLNRSLRLRNSTISGTFDVSATGYALSEDHTRVFRGKTHGGEYHTTKSQPIGGTVYTYTGIYIPVSIHGMQGFSGAPVIQVGGGVIGLYSSSSGASSMVSDVLKISHLDEIP